MRCPMPSTAQQATLSPCSQPHRQVAVFLSRPCPETRRAARWEENESLKTGGTARPPRAADTAHYLKKITVSFFTCVL